MVVTLPRRGTRTEALEFVARQRDWIEKRRQERTTAPIIPPLLLGGERVEPALETAGPARVLVVGPHRVLVGGAETDAREAAARFLRRRAAEELPRRTREFAAAHGIEIRGVTVRNQRSRWGSCSAQGRISLNWRLVQTPDWVRDYVIIHELMHRREMNHSPRFWSLVASVCPRHREARQWIRRHGRMLE